MRCYVIVFFDVVNEVGGMEKIQYVCVRDIIGRNVFFVGQFGIFLRKFDDVFDEEKKFLKECDEVIFIQILEIDFGVFNDGWMQNMFKMFGG